jgi:2-methylcitrate dehydratase PrpD
LFKKTCIEISNNKPIHLIERREYGKEIIMQRRNEEAVPKNILTDLARYVVDLKFESLPSDVVYEVKKALLDFLGAALAGSRSQIAQKVVDVIAQVNDMNESTIIGYPLKTSAPNATFANAAIGSYLELDDLINTHIGVIVMPAAIAMSEKLEVPIKQFITAIVVGYEVQARISKEIGPAQFRRGIDHCGCGSTFGSAVTTAKLLNLSLEQTCHAISIAGSLTPISCEEWLYYGSLVKPLEIAQAAQIGVLSALFAQSGIDGPPTIFEGEKGFCQTTAAPESFNLDRLSEGLGTTFEILNNYYKPYASCAWTHAPIEAILSLLKQNCLTSADIESVTVRTHRLASDLNNKWARNELQAKFSIPYALAVAATNKEVLVDQFAEKKLKDPNILALAQKVDVIWDEKINEGAIVEVLTRDGRNLIEHVEKAQGICTYQDIVRKFTRVIPQEFSTTKSGQIIQAVANLERIHNVSELTDLLYPK